MNGIEVFDDGDVMVVGQPNIGYKMKRTREIHGVKQGELGKRIGASQQTISLWQNSDIINKSSLEKYANGLGISIDEIINFEEKTVMQFFNCVSNGGGSFGNTTNGTGDTYNNTSPELLEILERFSNLLAEIKAKTK